MDCSLNKYIENSIKTNWNELALTDLDGVSFRYGDIGRKIAKLHIAFAEAGIQRGDKIALCGRNSSQWAVVFLAIETYCAVAVPLLHDFKADNLHHLINHSDSKLVFLDEPIWDSLDPTMMPNVQGFMSIKDFSLLESRSEKLTHARKHLNELFGKKYPERFTASDVSYSDVKPDELAAINYTSGSTGFSKGVMIPHRAFASNVKYCLENLHLHTGDTVVCMLPLAHMYGLSIDLLNAFSAGCHMFFLTRTSARLIVEAFARVQPRIIVSVPLILEKIIKKNVFPLLEKPLMKLLMRVPYVDTKLMNRIKDELNKTFGGKMDELIIGGAALNREVAEFLQKIGFHYTVGYGMTECAPLIAYAPWNENKLGACGRIVDRMQGRIDSIDPMNTPGELWVKGENVMLGYYKNQEATDAVFKDGWMNTGDLATMDSDGFLFLRGRSKNMILGPSGQNIYPEEIEQMINNLPYVNESLVIEENNTLKALVYPDFDSAASQGIGIEELQKQLVDSVKNLNADLPRYSQIAGVQIYNEEFEKTPKRSIKRYLYQH